MLEIADVVEIDDELSPWNGDSGTVFEVTRGGNVVVYGVLFRDGSKDWFYRSQLAKS